MAIYRGKEVEKERKREDANGNVFCGTRGIPLLEEEIWKPEGKKHETVRAESGKIAWLRGNARFSAANRIS